MICRRGFGRSLQRKRLKRMNDRSLAISILQKARDALSERLTERVIESQGEIEADAWGVPT